MNKEVFVRVGELLRLERSRRQLELSAISNELKITETHLAKIEEGDADALPAELYFHLFAKSYASVLGIDYTRTIESLQIDLGDEEEVVAAVVEPQHVLNGNRTVERVRKGFSRRPYSWAFTVVVISLALGTWGVYKLTDEREAPGSYENAATSEGVDAVTSGIPTGVNPSPALSLSILARVGSYAHVVSDGDTVVSGELMIGRDYQIEAESTLVVSLGTPEAVDVRLNGMRAKLVDPRTGRVRSVVISRANARQYIVSADGAVGLPTPVTGVTIE